MNMPDYTKPERKSYTMLYNPNQEINNLISWEHFGMYLKKTNDSDWDLRVLHESEKRSVSPYRSNHSEVF